MTRNEYDSFRQGRTKLSTEHKRFLEHYFQGTQFPTTDQRRQMARDMRVRERTIQIWFQNARQKLKGDIVSQQDYEGRNLDFTKLYKLGVAASRLLRQKRERR